VKSNSSDRVLHFGLLDAGRDGLPEPQARPASLIRRSRSQKATPYLNCSGEKWGGVALFSMR